MAHPKSVEERIEESEYVLEGLLDRWALRGQDDAVDPLLAIACELRALRLMLREEIREAAWPLKDLASRAARLKYGEPLTAEEMRAMEDG
jgi:cytidylate kinase